MTYSAYIHIYCFVLMYVCVFIKYLWRTGTCEHDGFRSVFLFSFVDIYTYVYMYVYGLLASTRVQLYLYVIHILLHTYIDTVIYINICKYVSLLSFENFSPALRLLPAFTKQYINIHTYILYTYVYTCVCVCLHGRLKVGRGRVCDGCL